MDAYIFILSEWNPEWNPGQICFESEWNPETEWNPEWNPGQYLSGILSGILDTFEWNPEWNPERVES